MYHLMYPFKTSWFVTWPVDVFHLTHVKRNLHLNRLKQWSLFWIRKRLSASWVLRIYVVFRWMSFFNACWRKCWGSSQFTSWYCMLSTQPSRFIFIKVFLLSITSNKLFFSRFYTFNQQMKIQRPLFQSHYF